MRCGRAMILDANIVRGYGVRRGVRVRFQTPRTRKNVENDIIPESCILSNTLTQKYIKIQFLCIEFS